MFLIWSDIFFLFNLIVFLLPSMFKFHFFSEVRRKLKKNQKFVVCNFVITNFAIKINKKKFEKTISTLCMFKLCSLSKKTSSKILRHCRQVPNAFPHPRPRRNQDSAARAGATATRRAAHAARTARAAAPTRATRARQATAQTRTAPAQRAGDGSRRGATGAGSARPEPKTRWVQLSIYR